MGNKIGISALITSIQHYTGGSSEKGKENTYNLGIYVKLLIQTQHIWIENFKNSTTMLLKLLNKFHKNEFHT
jgi:hypothetical protein